MASKKKKKLCLVSRWPQITGMTWSCLVAGLWSTALSPGECCQEVTPRLHPLLCWAEVCPVHPRVLLTERSDTILCIPKGVLSISAYYILPHLSFSFPRNCIGQNFALNEMKVTTALTLKRYELVAEPSFKPKLIARVVLRSVTGVHIKLRSIKKQKWGNGLQGKCAIAWKEKVLTVAETPIQILKQRLLQNWIK